MRDLHKFRPSALAGHPPYRVDHQPPSGSVLQPLLITVIIWVWSRTMTFLLWLQKEERSWSFFINNRNPGYSMTIQISRYSPSYGNKKALWWNAYSVLSDGSPVLILISSIFKGRWQLVNSFKYLILKSFCYSPHSLWGRYYDYSYFTKEENTLPPLSPYPKGTHGWRELRFKSNASDSRACAIDHLAILPPAGGRFVGPPWSSVPFLSTGTAISVYKFISFVGFEPLVFP